MALVDEQGRRARLELLLRPLVRLYIPHLCGEYLRRIVLHHSLCPCGYALSVAAFPVDVHLEEVTMLHGLGWQLELPVVGTL